MKRVVWLAGAWLLGVLLVVAVMRGVRTQARAAEAAFRSAGAGSKRRRRPQRSRALRSTASAHALDVVINEVAWAGQAEHTSDEWIELYNNTAQTISLGGWRLYATDGQPDLALTGDVPPQGYYLVERTDEETVSDVAADWVGSFGRGLSNGGETLILEDDSGTTVDTANVSGGGWPAGSATPTYRSMERVDPTAPDTADNWASNDGVTRNGLDAGGCPINGTPKAPNSCHRPPDGDVADLVVAKNGPSATAPGTIINYHIAISNTGSVTAASVRLTDTLPTAVDFITQSSRFAFTHCEHGLVWHVGGVPTDAVHLFTVTARVTDTASGVLTNRITATTTISERTGANNSAAWPTAVLPPVRLYALAPANYAGSGEAAALINLGTQAVQLGGWGLNDAPDLDGGVRFPTTATMGAGQILWLAQDADGFYPVWGFDADWAAPATTRPVAELEGDWPHGFFADAGDAAYLLDAGGNVADALAYGTGSAAQAWTGPAAPYPYGGFGSGQVLYRKLNQCTGLPVADTDSAVDWAQDPDDPIDGRRVRYPGWDLEDEDLFFPAEITATATFTMAVAPDGACDVVSRAIGSAQHTLRIEAYTLESVPLYQAICDRIQAGVVVTVLLESDPAGGMEDVERWIAQRLHDPPASTVYFIGQEAPRYQFQHAKVILVDDRLAVVSSDNFGQHSMPADRKDNGTMGHRGFVAATDSPGVIARLGDIFRRDCDPAHHKDVAPYDETCAPPGEFSPLPSPDWTTYTAAFTAPLVTTATHVTVLHAPEHALRDRDGLLGLLGQAGRGDEVAAMQMSEPFTWTAGAGPAGLNPRVQALIGAARAGARVRVLLDDYYDDPLATNRNTAACVRLNETSAREGMSLTCRLANVTGLGIHAKVFMAHVGDERWVHVGSINGSENSNKNNREIALQLRSARAHEWMQGVFEHDWAASHPPMTHRIYLPIGLRDWVPPADYPLVTEVFVNPGGDDTGREWIELYNPGPDANIAGWTLGDAIRGGDYGDGRHAFPAGAHLRHGQVIVAAACATDFSAAHGFNPTYEWTDCDAAVTDLAPAGSWDGFGMALGNSSDEVLLLEAGGGRVDSAAWGGGLRAGVTPFTDFSTGFPSGASLKRYPPGADRDDCAQDFYVSYGPSPGIVAGH